MGAEFEQDIQKKLSSRLPFPQSGFTDWFSRLHGLGFIICSQLSWFCDSHSDYKMKLMAFRKIIICYYLHIWCYCIDCRKYISPPSFWHEEDFRRQLQIWYTFKLHAVNTMSRFVWGDSPHLLKYVCAGKISFFIIHNQATSIYKNITAWYWYIQYIINLVR